MNLANTITLTRIIFTPIFLIGLFYYSPDRPFFYNVSVVIFFVVCLSDALDGYVARRLNACTVVGSYIDPIADKLLLLTGFGALTFMAHLPEAMRIPVWLTVIVIARDVIILLGSAVIFLVKGKLKVEPSKIGKLTTVMQMATVGAALLQVSSPAETILFISTALVTVLSGLLYVRGGRRTLEEVS